MATKPNYTLRRVVVLALLFALIAGIFFAVATIRARSDNSDPVEPTSSLSASPTPTPTPTPSPTPTPTDEALLTPTTCPPESLQVGVTADANSYSVGQPATFTVTITNVGTVPCLTDGGTEAVSLTIMSGNDRIWGSADCLTEPAARPLLLEPGVSDERFVAVWYGERSQEGCPAGLAAPLPGTYTVAAVVGGTSSPATVFQITG